MKHTSRAKYFSEIFYNIAVLRACSFFILFFIFSGVSSQNPVPFTFELSTASRTSAGIFKKDSTLVRTLWNNVKYEAGTHTAFWDRKDDEGRLLNDTGYIVRVISNNFTYQWEGGIIGNTSDSMTGSSKHRYFEKPNSMAISGNFAYFSSGYSEGITSAYKFNLSTPQNRTGILGANGDADLNTEFTATDGKHVYWAGFDAFNTKISLVYGTNVSDDKEAIFSSGTSVSMTYGRTYISAMDANADNPDARPSGLAVQKNGNYLFVSHQGLNELHVLNKSTGALVKTISVTKPRQLCVDMNDNLWMISDINSLHKFTVDSNGKLSLPALSIIALSDPVALAVSPNNYLIVVVDAGISQQLKAFDNASATPVWTLGQAGGYAIDPEVKNEKFYFRDVNTQITGGILIAFQQDSSFWLGDPGNDRIQHFTAERTFIDNIMSMPCTYSVKADINNPTRVFNNFLEFRIDYSKPLAPNNGSWTLVRNWRRGVPAGFFGSYSILRNVITLGNGRTYATMEDKNAQIHELVELPASGHPRFTGIKLNSYEDFLIDRDGTLRTIITGGVTDSIQWTSRTLTGFSNNDPVWSSPVTIASSPPTTIDDPKPNGMSFPAKTSSDRLIVFCPRKNDGYGLRAGYHLGAVKKGTRQWLWKASKSTQDTYMGPMPTDGTFDIGNGVEYPGGEVYTMNNDIFWNYHGEFWKNSQTNIWNHYADNGLMIGQFGITTPDGESTYGPEAFPMGAGNVFSSVFVKVDDNYYLYHNDESVHGAVHRWKISGLNTFKEQSINISLANSNKGLTATYFNGNDLNNVNLAASEVVSTVNLRAAPSQVTDANKFSVRWTGFVQAKYKQDYTFHTNTSKGVRLWIDGQLLIDRWTNNSPSGFSSAPIKLETDKRYTVKMEINGGTATLSWSSLSQSKQVIPADNLYFAFMLMDESGIDLLDGLNFNRVLEDGLYGWNRNPALEDNTSGNQYWHIKTSVKTYQKETPDLYMTFKRDNGQYQVSRDLGKVSPCNSSWKLSGHFNFEDNNGMWDQNGGSYIDILDDQGKLISRITHENISSPTFGSYTQIKCNGEAIFNEPNNKVDNILNKAQPFEISLAQTGLIFSYANFVAMRVTVFDTGCHRNRPETIRFGFIGGSNNQQRALDISRLRFVAASKPKITILGTSSFCEGQSVNITSNKSNTYLWNTGSQKQSITVSAQGNYSVTTADASGCSSTSSPIFITVHPNPKPMIQVAGNSLISNIDEGNQWYFEGKLIPGANSKEFTADKSGTYMLVVSDSNQCSGSATYEFKTNITENDFPGKMGITPNPSNGIVNLQVEPGLSGSVTVYDTTGQLVLETETPQEEINLSACASGIYTLMLVTGKKTYHFKLIIQ